MNSLSNEQKQLIFDYCLGLTMQEQAAQAQNLIDSDPQADEIYSKLKAAFAPLDTLEDQICPDELVESTIFRLNNAARTSQLKLQQLIAAEQSQKVTTQSWLWQNIGSRLAIAAVFMIVGTVLITAFNSLTNLSRQSYLKQQCQMQLSKIFRGLNRYSADNNGKLPAVATSAGDPWWKVGYQGNENHSNTRGLWLLVKGGYATPNDFSCPAAKPKIVLRMAPAAIQKYNDFPTRRHINYSLRLMNDSLHNTNIAGSQILMADSNPLFENITQKLERLELKLNKPLLTRNSSNHNQKGQNILFSDGSTRFEKRRKIGIARDDIFTLQNTEVYKGCELPSNESDVFLAP